jgi:hypothetical protein
LGQHTGFWKPELNGQTALSYMLAWLRKQRVRICESQALPWSFGTIAWSGEHQSFRSLPKSCPIAEMIKLSSGVRLCVRNSYREILPSGTFFSREK